jgi:hypothetical protein
MVLNTREQQLEGEDTTTPFARSTGQVRPLSIFICIFFVIYEIIYFNIFVLMKFSVILEKNKFGVIIGQNIEHPIKDGWP